MPLPAVAKEGIVEALDELSPDKLAEVGEFIEFLRFKGKKEPRRLIQLGGLWQDLPPVTEEDIAEARREMWGRLGEDEV
jgi:hypothetical protein